MLPKIENVPEPFRERAQAIRLSGIFGLVGIVGFIAVLLVKIAMQAAGAVDDVWQGPSWNLVVLVILIGFALDIVAIVMRVQSGKLKAELGGVEGAALEIANRGLRLSGVGLAMIFLGPFIFGWLLFKI